MGVGLPLTLGDVQDTRRIARVTCSHLKKGSNCTEQRWAGNTPASMTCTQCAPVPGVSSWELADDGMGQGSADLWEGMVIDIGQKSSSWGWLKADSKTVFACDVLVAYNSVQTQWSKEGGGIRHILSPGQLLPCDNHRWVIAEWVMSISNIYLKAVSFFFLSFFFLNILWCVFMCRTKWLCWTFESNGFLKQSLLFTEKSVFQIKSDFAIQCCAVEYTRM